MQARPGYRIKRIGPPDACLEIEVPDVLSRREITDAVTHLLTPSDPDLDEATDQALAANPDRISAVLVNDSDTDIYIKLGADPAVGTGIKLSAYGGSFAITAANLYTGLITAICASAEPKTLLVTEF